MPDDSCQSGGTPSTFCNEGFGECCGVSHGTANEYPNDSSCSMPCTPTGPPPYNPNVTYFWDPVACQWRTNGSPIIIDTKGAGFKLTSVADGVVFDISGTGNPVRMAWTTADSGNAFLALDRNQKWNNRRR